MVLMYHLCLCLLYLYLHSLLLLLLLCLLSFQDAMVAATTQLLEIQTFDDSRLQWKCLFHCLLLEFQLATLVDDSSLAAQRSTDFA